MSDGYFTGEVDRRRVKSEDRKSYQIKNLWEHSHRILRLAAMGLDGETIAAMVGVGTATVSNTINSRLGQRKLLMLRDAADAETIDIMTEIKKLAPKALKVLEELLDAEKDEIKFKAAADVLDRGGYGAKIDIRHLHAHLTAQDIDEIKQRGKQLALEQAQLVTGGVSRSFTDNGRSFTNDVNGDQDAPIECFIDPTHGDM